MTTITLDLPEPLAQKVSSADPQTIQKALEEGLGLQTTGDKEQATEHPHITRTPGILGGRPIIRGSRIPVWQIVEAILYLGETVEGYLVGHPHLSAAKIHDALSYYFDYRDEIEREIEENKTENVTREFGIVVDERGLGHFAANKPSNK